MTPDGLEALRALGYADKLTPIDPVPATGGVYWMLSNEHVKIGYSKGRTGVMGRIETFKTGNQYPLHLLAVTPGGQAEEQAYHKQFEHLRERGEWFKLTTELADHLCALRNAGGLSAPVGQSKVLTEHFASLTPRPVVLVEESGLFYTLSSMQGTEYAALLRAHPDWEAGHAEPQEPAIYEPLGPDLEVLRVYMPTLAHGPRAKAYEDDYDYDAHGASPFEMSLCASLRERMRCPAASLLAGCRGVDVARPASAPRPGEGFRHWFRRQDRNDRVGDLARDLRLDGHEQTFQELRGLIKHVQFWTGCDLDDAFVECAREGWSEYKTGFRTFVLPSVQGPLLEKLQAQWTLLKPDLDQARHVYRRERKHQKWFEALEADVVTAFKIFNLRLPPKHDGLWQRDLSYQDHLRTGRRVKAFALAVSDLFLLHARWVAPDHPALLTLSNIGSMKGSLGAVKCFLDDMVARESRDWPAGAVRWNQCYYGADGEEDGGDTYTDLPAHLFQGRRLTSRETV